MNFEPFKRRMSSGWKLGSVKSRQLDFFLFSDQETVDTPMAVRKNWFQRQIHRMGSLRSTSTSYSSGRLFARTRHNSVYSSPESGIPISGSGEGGANSVPNTVVLHNQKMSLYDRIVGRKSSRGPQKKPGNPTFCRK